MYHIRAADMDFPLHVLAVGAFALCTVGDVLGPNLTEGGLLDVTARNTFARTAPTFALATVALSVRLNHQHSATARVCPPI